MTSYFSQETGYLKPIYQTWAFKQLSSKSEYFTCIAYTY